MTRLISGRVPMAICSLSLCFFSLPHRNLEVDSDIEALFHRLLVLRLEFEDVDVDVGAEIRRR